MADEIECVAEASPPRRITRSAAKSASKRESIKTQQSTTTSSRKGNRNQQSDIKGLNKKSSKAPKSGGRINRRILEDDADNNNNIRDSHPNDDKSDSDTCSYDNDNQEDFDYNPNDNGNQGEDSDDDVDDSDDDDSDYSDEEKLITPLALVNETNVRGQDVFGFQTPRGWTGSLAQAASEAIHVKKTPASSKRFTQIAKKNTTSTRKRFNQVKHVQEKEEKQTQQKKSRRSVLSSAKSPAPSSSTTPQAVSQTPYNSDEEAAEGSSNDSDASGFVNGDDSDSRNSKKFPADLPEDSRSMVEEYFAVHHDAKCITSDRTLSSLATPLMDHEEISKHLKQVSATHPTESLQFYQDYRKNFAKWMFQIRHGFNLLLYGVGSKRVLVDQFRSSMLQGYTQLVVNGYFPSITVKNILNMITEDVFDHHGAFKNIIDHTTFIQDTFRKGKAPGELYLIIHNIDGTMLRSKKAQTVLSLLAEIPFIHVIASIDHINAPLVWDQCMCSRFKFLWYDVTTFEPYTDETSYENSLMVQQTGTLALSSMNHVMRSLTLNGQNIFLLIVNHQLQEKENSSYIGYSIYDLYNKCREKFFVNSQQTLRAQLTEFRDHKLIRSKKGADGVEHLLIPLDSSTLKQFLEEQQNNQ